MQEASEKGEAINALFVASWLLCTAHGFCFVFHLLVSIRVESRRQILFGFNLTVKNCLSLLAFYKTVWKITSVHACVCIQVCACTKVKKWYYSVMCTACKAIINLNMLFYLQKKFSCAALLCRTVTWSSTGCLTASAKSAMTVVRNSPPSVGGTTVDSVGRSSVVDAAIKKSLENSWATQVGSTHWEVEHCLCALLCLYYCVSDSDIS